LTVVFFYNSLRVRPADNPARAAIALAIGMASLTDDTNSSEYAEPAACVEPVNDWLADVRNACAL
jgi:hypothetical protein